MEIEAKGYIERHWKDIQVANWVIDKLPLLELGNKFAPCPVYEISLSQGLLLKNNQSFDTSEFKSCKKMVISGGFEGTVGHMSAIEDMREAGRLMDDGQYKLALMLEPDSYIQGLKNRKPLVSLSDRLFLWSTSGLVDSVIVLPEREKDETEFEHYRKISEYISPANWCVNLENKHKESILARSAQDGLINPILLSINRPEVHASFLSSTKELNREEVKKKLFEYLTKLVNSGQSTRNPSILDAEHLAQLSFDRLVGDL